MKKPKTRNQAFYSKRLGRWTLLYAELVKACTRGWAPKEIEDLKKRILKIDAEARKN